MLKKLKKTSVLIFTLICTLLLFTACSGNSADTGDSGHAGKSAEEWAAAAEQFEVAIATEYKDIYFSDIWYFEKLLSHMIESDLSAEDLSYIRGYIAAFKGSDYSADSMSLLYSTCDYVMPVGIISSELNENLNALVHEISDYTEEIDDLIKNGRADMLKKADILEKNTELSKACNAVRQDFMQIDKEEDAEKYMDKVIHAKELTEELNELCDVDA